MGTTGVWDIARREDVCVDEDAGGLRGMGGVVGLQPDGYAGRCECAGYGERDGSGEQGGCGGCGERGITETASDRQAGTLVLKVAYDGTDYAGFAIQEKQTHVRTIAGELLQAVRIVLRRDVEMTCCGRTDAGVHSRSQYVSMPYVFEGEAGLSGDKLRRSLNAVLPEDIRVLEALSAREGFSARFDCRSRWYRYRMSVGPTQPLFAGRYVWWIRRQEPLDLEAMGLASRSFLGEHDYKSFCKTASAIDKPTCRYVERVEFGREDLFGEEVQYIDVVGNAFLHSMVRTMVGTLVEVGEGRRKPEWVAKVLEAKDRRAAGSCAPACGLMFWDASYDENVLMTL